jgi:hypothetical protein
MYLFPHCLDQNDMELIKSKEKELKVINYYSRTGFIVAYIAGMGGYLLTRGRSGISVKNIMKHSILALSGTFLTAISAERLAKEIYYNNVLIQLSNKYNFTPEDLDDL